MYPQPMDSDKQTTPKGVAIPTPTRADWEKVLRKAATPNPDGSTTDGPDKK